MEYYSFILNHFSTFSNVTYYTVVSLENIHIDVALQFLKQLPRTKTVKNSNIYYLLCAFSDFKDDAGRQPVIEIVNVTEVWFEILQN